MKISSKQGIATLGASAAVFYVLSRIMGDPSLMKFLSVGQDALEVAYAIVSGASVASLILLSATLIFKYGPVLCRSLKQYLDRRLGKEIPTNTQTNTLSQEPLSPQQVPPKTHQNLSQTQLQQLAIKKRIREND